MEPTSSILGEGCPEVLHDFDQQGVDFNEIRRLYQFGEYIGGSEAASVLGCNPYTSALTLWMQKSGREDIPDISDKPAVRWGNLLEPIVLSETAEILGVHIEKPNFMYLHPLYPFMTANFDGVTEDGRLVEVKTTDSYKIKSMMEAGQIPPQWMAQIHHYACFSIPEWHSMAGEPFKGFILSVKTHMQKDPYVFDEDIDWVYCEDLIRKEQEFCQMVKDGTPPQPDGSDSSSESVRLLPIGEGEMEATDEIRSHHQAAKDAARDKTTAEKAYKFHKNYIHALMSEKKISKIRGCAYTQTTSRLNQSLLKKRLAEHNLSHLIEECKEESPPFLKLV